MSTNEAKACPYCGVLFEDTKDLTLHIVTRHTRRFSFPKPQNNEPDSRTQDSEQDRHSPAGV